MATRRELVKDIKDQYGNALNIQQVADYMGCSRDTASKILVGLEYFTMGRDKRYLAIDLAKRLEGYTRM